MDFRKNTGLLLKEKTRLRRGSRVKVTGRKHRQPNIDFAELRIKSP